MEFICCVLCGQPYPEDRLPYLCDCGGVFSIEELPPYLPPQSKPGKRNMWNYSRSFGLGEIPYLVTLNEGNTPLVRAEILGREVFLKLEYLNPTGSFKDRGSSILISFLRSRNVWEVVEDSSGNAGASLAGYASRAGIHSRIFVPDTTSGPKREQIEKYGADLVPVPGPRSEAARAVRDAVQNGCVYASHVFMPMGLVGIATIAYELYECFNGAPGTVITPIGHGGLMYGLMLGFDALLAANRIKKLPYFIGVQAKNCPPMVDAYRRGVNEIIKSPNSPTLAEGASVVDPVNGKLILNRMLGGGGKMESASEEDITKTYRILTKQGFYCEPTACLPLTALLDDKIELTSPVVLVLTGTGYKTNCIL